jgi:MoaA/NifB/PqqE/SkfB family radical SAM enzyme
MVQTPENVPPRYAVLFTQPMCDMSCTFCATEDGFDSLSLEQGCEGIAALHSQGIDHIILGGGEPFFWKPGVLKLAAFAKSLGCEVQIGTNGIRMPTDICSSEAVDRFILPLESLEPSSHNSMRLYPDHHGLIQNRLKSLGEAGKSVTISTVVTSVNATNLTALGAWLSTYHATYGNVHAWHLYRMLSVGRGGRRNGAQLDIGPEAYKTFCTHAREAAMGLRVILRPNMFGSRTVGFFWSQAGKWHSQIPRDWGSPAL